MLIPLLNLRIAPDVLALAASLVAGTETFLPHAARVLVLAVVPVPPGQPPAEGRNMARAYRALLGYLPPTVTPPTAGATAAGAGPAVPVHTLIKVAPTVGQGVREAVRSEDADLLLLPWKGYANRPEQHLFGQTLDDLLLQPPCNVVLVRTNPWQQARRVLLPLRGGPSAELALDLGLDLGRRLGVGVTVLHAVPRAASIAGGRREDDAPYLALLDRLRETAGPMTPPVEHLLTLAYDAPAQVGRQMAPGDLVILGLAEGRAQEPLARGTVLAAALADSERPVLIARAVRPLDLAAYHTRLVISAESAWSAEQWFVENTYHADEFGDPSRWMAARANREAHISVVLPTRNDSKRISSLLLGLRRALQQEAPIADEILVVDAGSEDDTATRAAQLGVPVLRAAPNPAHPGPPGPAALLSQALNLASGDILVWLDPKVSRLHPSYVRALVGPLLHDPGVLLVKPFWSDVPAGAEEPPPAGARLVPISVADLLALPLQDRPTIPMHSWVRAFYPRLGGVLHPLSRVFAARTRLLRELLPILEETETDIMGDGEGSAVSPATAFFAGLLLETAAQHSARAIAQVEMQRRPHGTSARRVASPDVRSARQIAELLALFATRADAAESHEALRRLRLGLLEAATLS